MQLRQRHLLAQEPAHEILTALRGFQEVEPKPAPVSVLELLNGLALGGTQSQEARLLLEELGSQLKLLAEDYLKAVVGDWRHVRFGGHVQDKAEHQVQPVHVDVLLVVREGLALKPVLQQPRLGGLGQLPQLRHPALHTANCLDCSASMESSFSKAPLRNMAASFGIHESCLANLENTKSLSSLSVLS